MRTCQLVPTSREVHEPDQHCLLPHGGTRLLLLHRGSLLLLYLLQNQRLPVRSKGVVMVVMMVVVVMVVVAMVVVAGGGGEDGFNGGSW